MPDSVIRVESLGKRYTLTHAGDGSGGRFSYRRFSDVLINAAKAPLRRLTRRTGGGPTREDFWALKDISFEVKRGEVVGIIGRNGAGKSTLLKILSRITEPTDGQIEIEGRVAALLEVGTGFHPELTGRENIFLNGAILGMSRVEIRSKFDEIVAFAEVERFLDTPVKHYSSGMYVRLAFSVAAHLEPEILIVDEVLAVGDTAFQKKCLGKIGEVVARDGRTVLFVSHNMGTIQKLCNRVILLKNGNIVSDGRPNEVVSQYMTMGASQLGMRTWGDPALAPGDDVARLDVVRIRGADGVVCTIFDVRDAVTLEMEYTVLRDVPYMDASFYVYNHRGELVIAAIDDSCDQADGSRSRIHGSYVLQCEIPRDLLNDGEYDIQVALTAERVVHALQRHAVAFQVGDAMNAEGARGNYQDGVWPSAAIRPKMRWTQSTRK